MQAKEFSTMKADNSRVRDFLLVSAGYLGLDRILQAANDSGHAVGGEKVLQTETIERGSELCSFPKRNLPTFLP